MNGRSAATAAAAVLYVGVLLLTTLGVIRVPGPDRQIEIGDFVLIVSVWALVFYFALGFAVGAVIGRWWTPLLLMVPDAVALFLQGRSLLADPVLANRLLTGTVVWLAVAFLILQLLPVLLGVGVHKLVRSKRGKSGPTRSPAGSPTP